MLRFRFSSGVVLGIAIGLPLGALIALMAAPTQRSGEPPLTSLQLQELTDRLNASHDAQLRPLRERIEESSRRMVMSEELAAGSKEQLIRIEQGMRALQTRIEGIEQRVSQPRQAPAPPPPEWQQYQPPAS